MKMGYMIVRIVFLHLLLLGGYAQAATPWELKQHPSGTLEVNGVTYIPSKSQWERVGVASLREGEVLKLNNSCTTSPSGLWKNIRVCTWETELHDRGSFVEKLPGDETEQTGWNARVFACTSMVLMVVFLLLARNVGPVPMGFRRAIILATSSLLLLISNTLTVIPLPGYPEPAISGLTYLTGLASLCIAFVIIFNSMDMKLRVVLPLFLTHIGGMVVIAIFT